MRNNTIDSLKGFAIILVVVGHLIQKADVNFDENIFFRFIYSFHMPLFFFLSGFVSKNKLTIKTLKRYFVALIIPFVSWAVIAKIFLILREGEAFIGIHNKIFKTIIFPDNGLWYLYVLFGLHILTFIEYKKSLKYVVFSLIFIVTLSYFINNGNFLGLKSIVMYAPYFYLGRLVYKKNEQIKFFVRKYMFLLISIFLLSVIFWHRTNITVFNYTLNPLFSLLYKYFVSFSGVFTFFGIFSMAKLNFLNFLGKHTLIIYILNAYFTPLISQNIESQYYVFVLFLYCLLICLVSILIEKLILKNKVSALLLLGKN